MSNPRFSIVIPAYNAGRYLSATLDSIQRQDFGGGIEVIIVDGGSSDETRSIVRQYRSLVSVFISEPDAGQLDALQKGLRLAKGDICHWLNADDIMMPGALSYVSARFEADLSVDLIYSDNFAFADGGRDLYVGSTIRGLTYRQHVLFYRQMYSECVYWKRKCTRYLPEAMFDLRVYTDYAFIANLRYGLQERWVSRRLGAFRIRADQLSARNSDRKAAEFERVRSWLHDQRGWSAEGVVARRLFTFPSFLLLQCIGPQIERGVRRVIRRLTSDRTRMEQSRIFFDCWMAGRQAPANIAEVLYR